MRIVRGRRDPAAAAVPLVLALTACARPLPPPGGEVDQEPPQLVATSPAPDTIVTDLDDPVVFEFDERIGERGLRDLVVVSPEEGQPRVDKGRRELRVSLPGGWRTGIIYRVVLLPGVVDMFGNATTEPFELVFSTGPEIPATALGGVATDRITGGPAAGARVEAIRLPDSARYVTATDTGGFFALRRLPLGEYVVRTFLDLSRNRRLEPGEPRDTARLSLADGDTAALTFSLLGTDTTPARVTRAEARDSLQIRVTVDDHLDPAGGSLAAVRARLWQLPTEDAARPDSLPISVDAILFPHELEALRTPPRPDTAVAAPGVAVPTQVLPTRDVVVVPGGPLLPATRYRVTLENITNIFGIPGGGGTAVFTTPARAPSQEEREE